MPRSFDISTDSSSSVEEVLAAFREQDYWLARLAGYRVDDSKLESLRVGGESGNDDTIEVVTLQIVHHKNLDLVFKQVHRGDVCLRRKETWGPVTDGVVAASFEASVDGAPAKVSGTGMLSPTAESGGCLLECELTVQVRVPLIGGKLEKLIGGQLANLVTLEQRFTTEWITNNA